MRGSDTSRNEARGANLAQVVREAREELGLSIRQLADAARLHHSFVSRLESGEYHSAKPSTLQRLSRVLEIDERDLMAFAGVDAPGTLPTFAPYLRAKYDMTDEAAKELQSFFDHVSQRYDVKEKPPAA